MNKNWFKEIEYTPEVIRELRLQSFKAGFGYITTGGLIEFDKAIRLQLRKELE